MFCSATYLKLTSELKDNVDTWGLPHLSAPCSLASSYLIQRACSTHSSFINSSSSMNRSWGVWLKMSSLPSLVLSEIEPCKYNHKFIIANHLQFCFSFLTNALGGTSSTCVGFRIFRKALVFLSRYYWRKILISLTCYVYFNNNHSPTSSWLTGWYPPSLPAILVSKNVSLAKSTLYLLWKIIFFDSLFLTSYCGQL